MNDLIIGVFSNYTYDDISIWINSVNNCGFAGDKVLIGIECYDNDLIQKIRQNNITFINANSISAFKPGSTKEQHNVICTERFFHLFKYLQNKNYRYVITTDVRDVCFQKNPVEFIEKNINDKKILFSSESIIYRDEFWGNDNLLHTFNHSIYQLLRNNEIFNVGVIAGYKKNVSDLCKMIYTISIHNPKTVVDQSIFNFLISNEPFKSTSLYCKSNSKWTAQLGTIGNLKLEDKLLEPPLNISNVKDFYIIHQYDRVPEINKYIKDNYA